MLLNRRLHAGAGDSVRGMVCRGWCASTTLRAAPKPYTGTASEACRSIVDKGDAPLIEGALDFEQIASARYRANELKIIKASPIVVPLVVKILRLVPGSEGGSR